MTGTHIVLLLYEKYATFHGNLHIDNYEQEDSLFFHFHRSRPAQQVVVYAMNQIPIYPHHRLTHEVHWFVVFELFRKVHC